MKPINSLFFIIAVVLLVTSTTGTAEAMASATSASGRSWETELFTQPSQEFNLDLAKFSLNLSAAAYGDTNENMLRTLISYGFIPDTAYSTNSYKKSGLSGNDTAAYTFAHQPISIGSKDYTLVAVVIRGTSGEAEWLSNFNINNSGNSPLVHEGFKNATDVLSSSLNQYMDDLALDRTRTKFLITGHSRGAAIANLLAADLSGTERWADASNIYAYTFATPNVAKINENPYLNIFNDVNPADIVTEVPLAKWGYSRYGVSYDLPEPNQLPASELAATRLLLEKLITLAPTVEDFYKAKSSLLFLQENLRTPSTNTIGAHAPQSYMANLNAANPAVLSARIFELQLQLLPNTSYI
ncbi:hypothetical protein Ami103574_01520 [Aminipila butyrica]|uniref:Fungal lipase-type domain-containing protein n=1 Tax=Aminipila butyrica TaxID=433296 RepID=A0A858BRA8_9FIRM|nr:lipase family protein [Aminipila butyrica]QIB68067.1 hypothetical protein Ami103574_01520 [Aminipila butyrica]